MLAGRNEAALRAVLKPALRYLRAEAQSKMPERGDFAPIQSQVPPASANEGAIVLTLGPAVEGGGTVDWERKRYLDVKVLTPSGKSESSKWIFFGLGADLIQELQNEAALLDKVVSAVQGGRVELLHHELP